MHMVLTQEYTPEGSFCIHTCPEYQKSLSYIESKSLFLKCGHN